MMTWENTDLSNLIAYIESGGRPKGGASEDSGDIPSLGGENIRQSGGLDLETVKKVPLTFFERMSKGILQYEDVLINKDGANTGKVGLYEDQYNTASINEHLFLLRGYPDRLNQRFLYYLLLSSQGQEKIREKISGSAQPGLKGDFIRGFPVRIPVSTMEQAKITDVLSTIDRAIEQTEALIAKYRRIKTGLMQDLLTRGIDENGQLRDPATHCFKPSPLEMIPEEWDIDLVKNLFGMELGKMLSKAAKRGTSPKPYLGNKNVQWGWIDVSNLETMDFFPHEQSRYRLKSDDILICEGGEVGRTALWKNELEECYFQKAIHRLKPVEDRVTPQYMVHYMWFVAPRGVLQNLTSQTSIAHLTQEKLADLPVCYPEPNEMAKITQVLDQLDEAIRSMQSELGKLQRLKTGLMQDLLTGKVSVAPLLAVNR